MEEASRQILTKDYKTFELFWNFSVEDTEKLRGRRACLIAGWTAPSAGTGPTGRPVCERTCKELEQ